MSLRIAELMKFPNRGPMCDRLEVGDLLHLMTPALEYQFASVPFKVLTGCINRGVGIEIECEDILESDKLDADWVYHKDGSLRGNSREYVSHFGIRVGHAMQKLRDFEEEILRLRGVYGKGAFKFSERTSVHVHMDIRQFTDDQLRALIILYTLFEDPLFDYAGPSRRSNVFTIPFRDSQYMANSPDIISLVKNSNKYCAFNLLAVQGFGTVEFRHMEGTEKFERIFPWVMLLSLLVRFAQRVPLNEIQDEVAKIKVESQYDIFIRRVFFGFSQLLRWNPNTLDESASDAKLFFKD